MRRFKRFATEAAARRFAAAINRLEGYPRPEAATTGHDEPVFRDGFWEYEIDTTIDRHSVKTERVNGVDVSIDNTPDRSEP